MHFILWTALIGLALAAWAGLIYFLIYEPVRLVRAARFDDQGRERLGVFRIDETDHADREARHEGKRAA